MAKIAAESVFGDLSTYLLGVDSYDSTKLGLGPLMVQNTGSNQIDKWAGPMPIGIARPMEQTTAIMSIFPWAMQWSSTIDWVFLVDNATATTTRRVNMYTFNRTTGAFTWQGFITCNMISTGNHTVRGFHMDYTKYTTGTVSLNGTTTVTGGGTTWQADRLAAGGRIGFGSTDPSAITTWYNINSIGGDTTITTDVATPNSGPGISYVIEELRVILATTSSTANQNGLHIAKGLRPELFLSATGTTIAASTTTDNVRATYWLSDAASSAHTTGIIGLAVQPRDSYTQHYVWLLDGTTTCTLYKYNIRGSLTLSSGKDTAGGFQLKTGASATLSGTAGQLNNGRYASLSHGPGSGSGCLYFTTTTKVYRTKAVSGITASDTTHISGGDVMSEVPPGGTTTFAASSLLSSVEHMSSIDKLLLTVNATGLPYHCYITQYRTDADKMDRCFITDTRRLQATTVSAENTPHPTYSGVPFSMWSEGGIVYMVGTAAINGSTTSNDILWAVPLGADWEYASTTQCRIITPSIATPNASKYVRAYVNHAEILGGAGGGGAPYNLGISPEPIRVYYRTTSITTDATSDWTLLPDHKSLSSVNGAANIQFMFEFRTIGWECVMPRIHSIAVLYEDLSTDSHYQPSATLSDAANKRFAWRFSTAWGGTVPTLTIRLYDAVTGSLLLTDNTASPSGTWQKSTDGSSWSSYNTSDKANDTTYIRYTPASLADNIRVRALLTS